MSDEMNGVGTGDAGYVNGAIKATVEIGVDQKSVANFMKTLDNVEKRLKKLDTRYMMVDRSETPRVKDAGMVPVKYRPLGGQLSFQKDWAEINQAITKVSNIIKAKAKEVASQQEHTITTTTAPTVAQQLLGVGLKTEDITSVKQGVEALIAGIPKDIKLNISLDAEGYAQVKSQLEQLTSVLKGVSVDNLVAELGKLNGLQIDTSISGLTSIANLGKSLKEFKTADVDNLITQIGKLQKAQIDFKDFKITGIDMNALKALSGLLNLQTGGLKDTTIGNIKALSSAISVLLINTELGGSSIKSLQLVVDTITKLNGATFDVQHLGTFANRLHYLLQILESFDASTFARLQTSLGGITSYMSTLFSNVDLDVFKNKLTGVFDTKAYATVMKTNPLSGMGKAITDMSKALENLSKNNAVAMTGVQSLVQIFGSLNGAIAGLNPATTTLQSFAQSLSTVISGIIHLGTTATTGAVNNIVVTGNSVAGNLNVVGTVMNSLASSQTNVANTANSASSAIASTGNSARGATGGVTNLNTKMKELGNSLRGLQSLSRRFLNYYAIRRILTLFKSAMDKAGDFDKSITMMNNAFGDLAPQVDDFATKMNRAFAINPNDVRKSVSMLGSLFNNAGLGIQESLDMSTVLTQMSYDLSSAFSKDQANTIVDIRSAIVGQTKAIEKYGVQMEQSYVEQVLLNEGLEIQMSTMSSAEKIMARYAALLIQTSDQQGFLGKMLQTTTGKIEAIKSSFSYLVSNTIAIFREMLKGVIDSVLRSVVFLSRVSEKMMEIMGIKAELSGAGETDDAYGELADDLDGVADSANKAKRSVASFDEVITLSDSDASKSGSDSKLTDAIKDIASKYKLNFGKYEDLFNFDEAEITRVAEKMVKVVTFIGDHFETILKTVGLIAVGMLAWRVGTGLYNVVTGLMGVVTALTGGGGLGALLGGATGATAGATGTAVATGATGTAVATGATGVVTSAIATVAGLGALAGAFIDAEENFQIFSKLEAKILSLLPTEESGFSQGLNGSIAQLSGRYSEMMEGLKMDWKDLGVIAGATIAIIAGGPLAVGTGALALAYEATKAGLLFGDMMDKVVLPDYVDITKGTSKLAEEALKPIKEDIDVVARSIAELWTGLSDPQDIDVAGLKQNFANISTLVVEDAKKTRDAKLAELDFVKDALAPEKYAMLVQEIEGTYSAVVANVGVNEAYITDTIRKAKEEQRDLTEDELTKIRTSYKDYQESVVNYASETEKDVTAISENLANNLSFWVTTSVNDSIEQANKLKDETIKSAEERYNNEVEVTQKLLEQGKITSAEADRAIAKAKEVRDETIEAANKSAEEVVNSYKNANNELKPVYESLQTGWSRFLEYMSGAWANFWNPIVDMAKMFTGGMSEAFGAIFGNAKTGINNFFEGMANRSVQTYSYPKLTKNANGGIATTARVGIFGEAGAEALIPLENSQFIEDFASKIASKSQGGSPQVVQNITIKIDSTFDDDFQLREKARKISDYIRAEQARVGYGF